MGLLRADRRRCRAGVRRSKEGTDRGYAERALTLACKFDLYRAAVFFLMMPLFAERSITENVFGRSSAAALAFLPAMALRIARIWCRKRVLFLRLYSVRRSVWRTRLSAE